MTTRKFCIILLRHTERLDREMEEKGLDWIHSADYPQDSPLSEFGKQQAVKIGALCRDIGLTTIYVSPMIRTVTTGDLVSRQLVQHLPLCVETGLIEEAKSVRGRHADEPKPVWIDGRLHHSPEYLKENYSDLIDLSYETLQSVSHSPDSSAANNIRENHEVYQNVDEITRDRCNQFILKLKSKHQRASNNEGFRILCVGHGASCSGCAHALEEGLPNELKIRGVRSVGSWGIFVPYDESNLDGPWYCPDGVWQNLPDEYHTAIENVADRGDSV